MGCEVSLLERKAVIDSLSVGDLIRLNGKLRVVRAIGRRLPKSHITDEQVYSVTLSIMHCSWTRRPYTVKGRCELYNVPLEVVSRGYGEVRGPLEVLLQKDIEEGTRILECCDVIGVIS